MIKFCVQQWDKNKGELEKHIREVYMEDHGWIDYKELVQKVVTFIFNDDESHRTEYDAERITEINDGDYQGTLLYMIPRKTYQPGEDDYLLTYVNYGSCSGCDTLQSVCEDNGETFVKGMMDLSLHLIQNTTKPFNKGWSHDEEYDEIGEGSEE